MVMLLFVCDSYQMCVEQSMGCTAETGQRENCHCCAALLSTENSYFAENSMNVWFLGAREGDAAFMEMQLN